jgi:hypothetical protein
MPGQAILGYGPNGQVYNEHNPVVNTTSGVRPQSAVNNRYLSPSGHAMTPQQYGAQGQQQYMAPNPFTRQGGSYGQPQQQSTNPLINAINGMFGTQQTGQTQGGYQQSGANVQTSINPSNIYSPQQTQEAANQARAGQSVPLPWLQGRFAGNGMSVNSPGVVTQSLPAYAQGLTGGMTAQAQIPFQDTRADAQHYLAGQQGRENEAQGWSRMLSSADSTNRNFQLNTLQSILSMLGSLGGV